MMNLSPLPLPAEIGVAGVLLAVLVFAAAVVDYYGGIGSWARVTWRLVRANDAAQRRTAWLAVRVLCGWPRVAKDLQLRVRRGRHRGQFPHIRRIRIDTMGVTVVLRTATGIGVRKIRPHCRDLADKWRVERVVAEQLDTGEVRLRLQSVAANAAVNPSLARKSYPPLWCGRDHSGEPVTLDLATTSGVGVHGRLGTSAFVLSLLSQLVPDPTVQCVVLDGKNPNPFAGDYGVLAGGRRVAMTGDNFDQANEVLAGLVQLRRQRAERMSDPRCGLGVTDFWRVGPTVEWPLVVAVIDSYTTLLARTPGRSAAARARNALAEANTGAVLDLLAHGAQYGIAVVLTTTESLPRRLQAMLSTTFAFACRGDQAAVAALGTRIRNFPEANPSGYTQPDQVTTITASGEYLPFRVSPLPAPLTH
ncbi:hypothetical protein [Nocardia asiatica]|uniref:hypothetical protein n=1 Tax=Nocardia asiatica TaxID=209252 RepID=UPI00030A0FD7|nr:hypothetical protein [Nocardia asiatica]